MGGGPNRKKKVWRIAVICIGCICLMEGVVAQNGATAFSREITLKQALEEIQKRTGYIVIVNYDNIPASRRVSMPSVSLGTEELVRHVLSGTGFTGEVVGQRILVVPEPPEIDNGEGAISAMWRTADEYAAAEMEIVTFRTGSTVLEAGFMGNAKALQKLGSSLTDSTVMARFDHISVTAASSPDGNTTGNERLAVRRAQTTKGYLEKRFPHIAPEKIQVFSAGEEWSGLEKLVSEDERVPSKDEVLALLETISPDANIRDSLMAIAGGRAWRYMAAELLPRLRGAAAITLHFANPFAEKRTDTLNVAEPEGVTLEGSGVQRVEFFNVKPPAPVMELPPAPEPVPVPPKPLFAVKTNALMDVVSAINLEVEVPIGNRWSLAGEVVFPWWMTVNGTLEARYWFGDRTACPLLTGWFAGAYFGGGTYGMRWNSHLHEGDFLHAGFSGGYAHPVNRSGNMRMEYSLGVGYLTGADLRLAGWEQKKPKWFGPTRAKVSVVWIINRKSSEE